MIIEKVINSIEIKITDENDNILDLNATNIHWSATLQFDFIQINSGFKIMDNKNRNPRKKKKRKRKNKSIDNI